MGYDQKFYESHKGDFLKCQCLKDLGNDRWEFKCEDGNMYVENLSIALSKEEASKLKVGSIFILSLLSLECATIVDNSKTHN